MQQQQNDLILSNDEFLQRHKYFTRVCTRNAILSVNEQQQLFDYLHDRQRRGVPNQKQQQQQQQHKVMNDVQEQLFMYRVLTQSITASSSNHNNKDFAFAVRSYQCTADYCVEQKESKQLFVCLTKLVYDIYPLVTDEELLKRREEFTSYYLLFLMKDSTQQLNVFLKRAYDLYCNSNIFRKSFDLYRCITSNNYFRFFKIIAKYKTVFPHGWYKVLSIVNYGIHEMRISTLQTMHRSYFSIPTSFVSELLLFESENEFCKWFEKEQQNSKSSAEKQTLPASVSYDESNIEFRKLPRAK
jgi:hypothetical protein